MSNYSYLLKSIFLFIAYFVTAKFGLTFDAVGGFATLVWLPSGISLSALLIFGYKFWPAITLGAFLANYSTGAPIAVAVVISIGNTLEALVGASLLKLIVDFRSSLNRLKDVLGLIVIAAIFSTTISATIGVSSLWFGNIISLNQYPKTWIAWWIGDLISDLVVAPFLLAWSSRSRVRLNLKHLFEATALSLILVFIGLAVFGGLLNTTFSNRPVAYLVFPPLLWAAFRFGTRGAATATFVLSAIAIWSTSSGLGPFSKGLLNENLLFLQLFMIVTSITAMIFAAIVSEREELERRKDDFISVASHELKTPLTTIKGYIDLLSHYFKNSYESGPSLYLLRMGEQITRLTKLTNDLLNVSKIQAGKLQLQKERFRIDELITNVIGDLQLTTKHKLIFEKNGKIPKIFADKYRISEVLNNLISNAIKYSPKAQKVFIRTSLESGLVISVQDFGIGISENDKDKIFQRFYRAGTKIRQSFSGLGLGLFISSEIIKRHGGNIWINSTKGRGSTVAFRLPLRRIS